MTAPVSVRWRRRAMPKVRVTWLAMVVIMFMLAHRALIENVPLGVTGKVATFIAMVLVPTVLFALWRLGLLPPERVVVEATDPEPGP